jgi:hypothetical protein
MTTEASRFEDPVTIRAWSYEVQSRSDSVSPDVFLHQPVAITRSTQRFFGWPVLLVTWLAFGLGKLDCDENRNLKI